jgi:hypothetical protein
MSQGHHRNYTRRPLQADGLTGRRPTYMLWGVVKEVWTARARSARGDIAGRPGLKRGEQLIAPRKEEVPLTVMNLMVLLFCKGISPF